MIYKILFFIFLGIVAGIFISLKWISPPYDDISIGKIKIKGRNNKMDGTIISGKDHPGPGKKKGIFHRKGKKKRSRLS